MGIGGISIWQLLIILVIVLLLFGTKKLRGMGKDLGGAVKGFKQALDEDERQHEPDSPTDPSSLPDSDDSGDPSSTGTADSSRDH